MFDWNAQFQKLKEAVLLLLSYSALGEERQEPNILTRIVAGHAARGIPGWMYHKFGDILIDSIVEFDSPPAHLNKQQLRSAWEHVTKPGIDYMRKRTDQFDEQRYRSASDEPNPAL